MVQLLQSYSFLLLYPSSSASLRQQPPPPRTTLSEQSSTPVRRAMMYRYTNNTPSPTSTCPPSPPPRFSYSCSTELARPLPPSLSRRPSPCTALEHLRANAVSLTNRSADLPLQLLLLVLQLPPPRFPYRSAVALNLSVTAPRPASSVASSARRACQVQRTTHNKPNHDRFPLTPPPPACPFSPPRGVLLLLLLLRSLARSLARSLGGSRRRPASSVSRRTHRLAAGRMPMTSHGHAIRAGGSGDLLMANEADDGEGEAA